VTELTKKDREAILLKSAMLLGEHFDSVCVVATYGTKQKTTCVFETVGNWYANCASMIEVAKGMEGILEPRDPDDDGDDWKPEPKT
jgi:hypothetical protein